MASIKSDIGSREFKSTGRRLTVPDESFMQDEEVVLEASSRKSHADDVMALRQQKFEQASKPTPAAKRRVEFLIGIGRAHREIPLDDGMGNKVTYKIQSLNGVQNKQLTVAFEAMAKAGRASDIYDVRTMALSFSIISIDGLDVNDVLDCSNEIEENQELIKKEFIEQLDEAILARLYDEFKEMTSENSKKYTIKSETEAQEVASDINKSGERA